MWEDKVLAAEVDVKGVAEYLSRHGRALDVPARAAGTDLGVPTGFARLGGFPQGKVARRIFFVFVYVHAGAVFHTGEIFFRQLPVLRELGDAEVIRAVFCTVSNAFFH